MHARRQANVSTQLERLLLLPQLRRDPLRRSVMRQWELPRRLQLRLTEHACATVVASQAAGREVDVARQGPCAVQKVQRHQAAVQDTRKAVGTAIGKAIGTAKRQDTFDSAGRALC